MGIFDRFPPAALRPSAPIAAALYMSAAAFGFSLMNVAIREAAQELSPLQVAFLRNFFAALTLMPWLVAGGFSALRTTRLKTYFWRAAVGLCAMMMWFTSLALLPLADAVALNFTVPLFATVGAALFLDEIVRARRWMATLVGFAGVLVILRPGFTDLSLIMLLPIAAALFQAMGALMVKSLSRTEGAGTVVAYMNLLLTPLSLVPALFVWQWPSGYALALCAFVGFTGAISHVAFTRAYALADASAVMPFDYMRLPFSAALAYLLYTELPDLWTWVGAGIIAASAIYIGQREAKLARERERAVLRAASTSPGSRDV
ncbi:DMT family transporter [Aquibaculum arenosum]|uniref:DMT family transporter n=1 Tax=Aquibaculum arenosum TaxID=3032591 RepID=A0ABT5YL03_9PROT|nr:DMT family transporter [Fodinicurvata sp. CAU 1616]MDF2095564.1 DMT family transporter [Fodinicurvata sp. CAU 1616]